MANDTQSEAIRRAAVRDAHVRPLSARKTSDVPREGEQCWCGEPAALVWLSDQHGRVGDCCHHENESMGHHCDRLDDQLQQMLDRLSRIGEVQDFRERTALAALASALQRAQVAVIDVWSLTGSADATYTGREMAA